MKESAAAIRLPFMNARPLHLKTAALAAGLLLVLALAAWNSSRASRGPEAPPPADIGLPFRYSFSEDGWLEEAGEMEDSSSPYWWLNSGAYLRLENGIGRTLQGTLPDDSPWRERYRMTDPEETDGGARPQNVFRLLLRRGWENLSEEAYFRIGRYDLSSSEHRSESNGLLLFQRYVDEENLYYAGLRVDGHAVIKKKKGGVYHTLAEVPVFPERYDRGAHPNLLPLGTWIGVKSVVRKAEGQGVLITLSVDIGKTGTWTEVAQAFDNGTVGGPPLRAAGHPGIRTDFMDVEFDDFLIQAP